MDSYVLLQIKDVRNACMHSCDLEIDDQAMRDGLGLMISLLEEPPFKNRQESIKAKTEILQVRGFCILYSSQKSRVVLHAHVLIK